MSNDRVDVGTGASARVDKMANGTSFSTGTNAGAGAGRSDLFHGSGYWY